MKILPLISVIMATYNYGRFIDQAIVSILGQTYPANRVEIIVVDDGSTDDTQEHLKKYGHRIHNVVKKNGGHMSGLNVGYEHSKGEIVAFLDPDDYWNDNKLEVLVQHYNQYGAQAVCHNMRLFGLREGVYFPDQLCQKLHCIDHGIYRLPKKDFRDAYEIRPILSMQSYRREVCQQMFPFPETFRYFADLPLQLMARFYCDIDYLHVCLGYYRQHADSHMANLGRDVKHKELQVKLRDDIYQMVSRVNTDGAADFYLKKSENVKRIFQAELEEIRGNRWRALCYMVTYRPAGNLFARLLFRMSFAARLFLPARLRFALSRLKHWLKSRIASERLKRSAS